MTYYGVIRRRGKQIAATDWYSTVGAVKRAFHSYLIGEYHYTPSIPKKDYKLVIKSRKDNPGKDLLGYKNHWQIQTKDQPTMWFKTKAKALAKARSLLRRGKATTGYLTLYNTKTGDYIDLGKTMSNPSLPKGKSTSTYGLYDTLGTLIFRGTKIQCARYKGDLKYTGYDVSRYSVKRVITNPGVPKGKFIPCKAVKINSNGSVSVRL